MVPKLFQLSTAWKKEKYATLLLLASSLNFKGIFAYRSKASQFLKTNKQKKSLVFLVFVTQTYVEVNQKGGGKAMVQAISSLELG